MNNIPIRTLSELQSYNASIKKEKDEWKNKATMLFNKNEELEKQNDSLRKKYRTILADNQEKEQRIALYTQKLERMQTQNRKLEKISVDSDLKKQYSDTERRKRKQEIDSYLTQIKRLTETCDNYKIQILDLQQQLNQMSQEKDVLLQAVELKADEFNLPNDDPNSLRIILEEGQQKQIAITLSEQLDQITKQYNMEKDHSSKLELLLNDKNEEIRSLQSYIDTHTNEREDLNNELYSAKSAVDDMNHRYNVLQSENQELQKYNKQLIDTIQQYQLSDDNMKQEMENMAERMNEMQVNQQEFTEIQNQTIELQTKLDEKDRLYNDLNLQHTQLTQQYNMINNDYNNLNDQYHYILEANATLTNELDEYKEQNLKKDSKETLEKRVDELSDIVKQQQENIQKQQKEVLHLRNENEKMESEMKEKNSDVILYQTKVAHLEAHILQLQSHIETLKKSKEVYERDRRSIDRTTPIINRINQNNDTSPGTYHDIISRSLGATKHNYNDNDHELHSPPSPLISSYNTRRSSMKNNNNNNNNNNGIGNNRRRTSLQPTYDNELPINDLLNNY